MIAPMLYLLLVLLTVAALIVLVSRCNDGRGLNAVLLLAGRLVTAYPSLEYLVLSITVETSTLLTRRDAVRLGSTAGRI